MHKLVWLERGVLAVAVGWAAYLSMPEDMSSLLDIMDLLQEQFIAQLPSAPVLIFLVVVAWSCARLSMPSKTLFYSAEMFGTSPRVIPPILHVCTVLNCSSIRVAVTFTFYGSTLMTKRPESSGETAATTSMFQATEALLFTQR